MSEIVTKPKVGIVFTVYNCLEYTINAVNSLRTTFPFHLIIIDDFSSDGTKQWLNELGKSYKEHWVQGNEGLCEGFSTLIDVPTESLGEKWNLGVTEASKNGCPIALICNNDILFHPATIDTLVNRWIKSKENQERIGIISAHNRRGDTKPEEIFTLEIPDPASEAESPDFSCFLMDIGIWQEIGKFDINYIPCYFEDGDTHANLAIHDYKAITTTAAPYYHFGSITQNSVPGGLCKGPQFEKLRDYFRSKWGCVPGEQAYDDLTHRRIKVVPVGI